MAKCRVVWFTARMNPEHPGLADAPLRHDGVFTDEGGPLRLVEDNGSTLSGAELNGIHLNPVGEIPPSLKKAGLAAGCKFFPGSLETEPVKTEPAKKPD